MSGYSRGQIGRAAFYLAAAVTLAIDQLSKVLVRAHLACGESTAIVPRFFALKRTENSGAAFGLLREWSGILVFIGSFVVIILFGLRKERSKSRLAAVSLGLLLGGALGNLIDRIAFGCVTDFLDFSIAIGARTYSWPTFNIADIAITAGIILFMYCAIFLEGKLADENKADEAHTNS